MVLGKPIDPQTEEFVQATIDSFVTWDVIVFFHDWPGFAGETAAVAKHLGRNEPEVERSLLHLVKHGMLLRTRTDGAHVYSFSPDSKTAERIEKFTSVLDQRDARLALLAALLRKGVR